MSLWTGIPLSATAATAGQDAGSVLQDVGRAAGRIFTADDVLSPYVYVFYAAFIIAYVFTPVMRAVATYYGIIDEPDNLRKMHKSPVAYLGGVAVFLGWVG